MPGVSIGPEAIERELRARVGVEGLASRREPLRAHDATEAQGLRAMPDAVVLPADTGEVAAVVRWCHEHDVPIVPRANCVTPSTRRD